MKSTSNTLAVRNTLAIVGDLKMTLCYWIIDNRDNDIFK